MVTMRVLAPPVNGGRRLLRVTLSKFSYEALARGEPLGPEQAQARIVRATRFYLHEGDRGRPGWSVPSALRRDERTDVELELELDDGLLRAVEVEAERQDVTLSRLVAQAAIYYAAEVDAGRITQRVLDDLEGGA